MASKKNPPMRFDEKSDLSDRYTHWKKRMGLFSQTTGHIGDKLVPFLPEASDDE